MIFYLAPRTVSVASHITLEEVGADYETRVLDFSASEQRSHAYLGINSKGRVPALVTDKGVITETPAFCSILPNDILTQTWRHGKMLSNWPSFKNSTRICVQLSTLPMHTESEAKDGPMMKTPWRRCNRKFRTPCERVFN